MERAITGDIRRFLTINTTEYNCDGQYGVFECDIDDLAKLGWIDIKKEKYPIYGTEKFKTIDNMDVGDIFVAEAGAYLMRIA